MKPFNRYYLLFVCVLAFAYCKKQKIILPQPPVEQLPAATQEGKNTCGFLVNGKLWLPKGKLGNGQPNLDWWYDPAYRNGTFNIHGSRSENQGDSLFTSFGIGISNCTTTGIYMLNRTAAGIAMYSNYYKNCIYYTQDTLPGHNSYINITKFDLQNRIISGTFQFSMVKPGCDTTRITEGRFDIKL